MENKFNYKKSHQYGELLEEVLTVQVHPEDYYEVAAIIESLGWNDNEVERQFGLQDVFALAQDIWTDIHATINYTPIIQDQKRRPLNSIKSVVRNFSRGTIFALPMAISILAMLNLRFSLWSYEYLSLEQATSIAIGTILSFVLVGGFTQAIARRGYYYLIQQQADLARKNTLIFIGIGYVLCFFVCILLVIFNFIFNLFPFYMIGLTVVYFFFLTSIWLSVTVMYVLKKELVFTGLIALGIFLVYVLFIVIEFSIILSQVISLIAVSVISLVIVFFIFLPPKKQNEEQLKLPRFSITLYTVWPYFFYGFLYFSFLFVDRIIAWSKNEGFMPYAIWFRGQYELGLDFALLTIIIPMGVCEVVVSRLMFDLESTQKKFSATQIQDLIKKYLKRYKMMTLVILLSTICSSFFIYRLLIWYNDYSIQVKNENLLSNEVTIYVLFFGIVSYGILSFCLMNIVLLFSLSQPHFVLKAIIPSLLVNIFIGFLLSRWIDYHYAVIGLFVGSVLLIIFTTRAVLHVIKKLDYYLYKAS